MAALQTRVIICFGATAGRYVSRQIGARELIGRYVEANDRKWRSEAYLAPDGRIVVTASHPSRTNWANPNSDPTPMIKRLLTEC